MEYVIIPIGGFIGLIILLIVVHHGMKTKEKIVLDTWAGSPVPAINNKPLMQSISNRPGIPGAPGAPGRDNGKWTCLYYGYGKWGL